MSTGNSIQVPSNVKDETGNPYGKLTVLSYAGSNVKALKGAYWNCLCECGGETVVCGRALRSGTIASCGCTKRAARGLSESAEYRVWHGMKRRCYDVRRRDYKYYGGRNVTVCDRWRESFVNFLDDMGLKPFAEATLERVDNNAGYEKSNCKWATWEEQKQNTRNVRKLTHNGETMSIGAWASKLGIDRSTLRLRLDKGWPMEEVFSPDTSFVPRSKARMLTCNGETLTMRAWARKLGVVHSTIAKRIDKQGWTMEQVVEHYRT